MGKASSSKKVARVAKTGGGRTKGGGQARSLLFPGAIVLTVILGITLVWVSRSAREVDASSPQPGEHWHAAIGFFICDAFAPDIPDSGSDPLGIHGHGDGLVHIHPFTALAAGERAVLDVYFDALGISVGENSFDIGIVDPVENDDDCNGAPGKVQMKVWDSVDESDPGRLVPGDPGDFKPLDGQLITIAFVPDGAEIPRPESVDSLASPSDLEPTPTVPDTSTTIAGDTSTTGAGDTATTVAGDTSTTAAGDTATTAAGDTSTTVGAETSTTLGASLDPTTTTAP